MTIDDILTQRRTDSTSAERIVLALEEIAAHLAVLAEPARQPEGSGSVSAAESPPLDNWENEGGTVDVATGVPDGIVHQQNDIYLVGAYRYTSLVDAIAQLRRSPATA